MPTTATQIEAVRALCQALEANPDIKAAHVDDWGRYGNFTIMVTPKEHTRSTTQRLKRLVGAALPEAAHLRDCFGPDPVYERRYGGRRVKVGYTRKFWAFDIDFQRYCPATNSFS